MAKLAGVISALAEQGEGESEESGEIAAVALAFVDAAGVSIEGVACSESLPPLSHDRKLSSLQIILTAHNFELACLDQVSQNC